MSKKKNRKTGQPPGTLIYTGSTETENSDVTIMQFNESSISEKLLVGLNCLASAEKKVTWYDVRGLSNIKLIEEIGHTFHIHPLALEDVLNTQQRPKWEDYHNGIFMVVRALKFDDKALEITTEQIAFFLGTDFLLCFQEDPDENFHHIRERLHRGQGKIRQKGADFLIYTLMDGVVDDYFLVLDRTEEVIENLEEEILNNTSGTSRNKIYQLKRQLSEIRRVVLPMRDVVGRFVREESLFVERETNIFIRDLYDHVVQVIELLESQRDMLVSLHELYNSELANRASHVMKVLTIVSAIFIPLTFIVGVYGTNFDNLPELHYKNSYHVMWFIMGVIAVGQLIYFKQKKWL